MQSFIIFCISFCIYIVGLSAEIVTWNRVLAVLDIEIISTSTFLGEFNLTEAYWVFLREQEFDTIVAGLKQVVQTFDKDSISWASFKQASWLIGFEAIRLIKKPTSSIRSFNTKVTTGPREHSRCSAWLAEASYIDKIFVC